VVTLVFGAIISLTAVPFQLVEALASRHIGPRSSPLFLGVLVLLATLAISRYDATSFVYRWEGEIDFFNWFWRHRTLGFLSFFDFLMLALLGLAVAEVRASGRWQPRPFDGLALCLLALVGLSSGVRLLHAGAEDTTRAFLYQLRNYAYFVAAYAVASRLPWTSRRLRGFAGLAAGLAVVTMALSWWEISRVAPGEVITRHGLTVAVYVMKYGRTVSVRDLSDHVFLFFLHFGALALLLEGVARRGWQKVLLLAVVAHGLYGAFTGVGRGVLVVYVVVLACFAWHYGFVSRRWLRPALAVGLVLIVVLGASVLVWGTGEGSPFHVYATFTSRDLATSTRVREALNLGANLHNRHAWLTGIGLGSKWYEYWPQPEADRGAYPPREWESNWHLGTHLAFARLLLDFGLLGTSVLLAFFSASLWLTMRAVRSGELDGFTRAFMVTSWAVVGYQVCINSLSGPKETLVAGLLMGAMAGTLSQAASAEQG
jgi:hypothetical protein